MDWLQWVFEGKDSIKANALELLELEPRIEFQPRGVAIHLGIPREVATVANVNVLKRLHSEGLIACVSVVGPSLPSLRQGLDCPGHTHRPWF